MPQFGATFYPGGVDDYLMPEVLAPLPQRCVSLIYILQDNTDALLLFQRRRSFYPRLPLQPPQHHGPVTTATGLVK